jgi:hypothetical protein
MIERHNRQTMEPPARLLRDLDAVGRMERNDRALTSERLTAALGTRFAEALVLALADQKRATSRQALPGDVA